MITTRRRHVEAGWLRRAVRRLEDRIEHHRAMLWQPRQELALAREIGREQRALAALRRLR